MKPFDKNHFAKLTELLGEGLKTKRVFVRGESKDSMKSDSLASLCLSHGYDAVVHQLSAYIGWTPKRRAVDALDEYRVYQVWELYRSAERFLYLLNK